MKIKKCSSQHQAVHVRFAVPTFSPEVARRLAEVPRTQSGGRTKTGNELGPWRRWRRGTRSMGPPG